VAPPAALGGQTGDATPGGFGNVTGGFNVNGMRNQSNNFLLDGATNNDTFNTGFVLRPPPDAIEEFKILTHAYTAEYGRNAGSVVNVVTKSGSNTMVGRALGVQPRRRAAGAQLLRAATQPKPELKQNQFGGSPRRPARARTAVRLRLLRGVPQRQRHHADVTVLSQAQRNGDFSASTPFAIPLTGLPFPGNTSRPIRISPSAPGC
jgi:hypothetical protein